MVDDEVVSLLGCSGFQSCFGPQSFVEAGLVSKKDYGDSSNWDCMCYQILSYIMFACTENWSG